MDQSRGGPGSRLRAFAAGPLRAEHPPMTVAADWLAAGGLAAFAVSVFALPWLTVGLKDVLGLKSALGIETPRYSYGLFVSPWAWVMVAVLALVAAGLWFVQSRGVVSLVGGMFCLVFNVVFFIGVWRKINAIIGDVVSLARSVPFIGEALGKAVSELAKSMLDVHVAPGFWLFVPAGLLLIAGGALRFHGSRRTLEEPVERRDGATGARGARA